VLFLDELPDFNRKSLEVLCQPLEEGQVTVARAAFLLVAVTKPLRGGGAV